METKKGERKWWGRVPIPALILCMVGSFLIFYKRQEGLPIYIAGVFLLLLSYLGTMPREGKPKISLLRKRRLHRIGFIGAVVLAVAAYMMYIHFRAWPVLFLIGAMMQIVYFFRAFK